MRKSLAQIVITKNKDGEFKVLLFDKKECLADEAHSADEAIELVRKSMKRLRVVEGL